MTGPRAAFASTAPCACFAAQLRAVFVALACAALAWVASSGCTSQAAATPPKGAENAAQKPPASAPATGSAPNATSTETHAGPASANVHIVFTTVPPAYAVVSWGKTVLGRIAPRKALVIARPRDSGPLDVVVVARGYLPVHTRAHTFDDSDVSVKLTRLDERATLFGYREPLDASLTDGGLPLADAAAPAPPPTAAPNAPPAQPPTSPAPPASAH